MELEHIINSYCKNHAINVHSIINDSFINGPGKRIVVWFHGCPFHCSGCFNPQMWDFENKTIISVKELAQIINQYDGDGVTFSGGEPMIQAPSFLELLLLIEQRNFKKGIICFTGCESEEINSTSIIKECIDHIDLSIIGRYDKNQLRKNYIGGSSNQQFVFLNKKGRGRDKISEDEILIDNDIEIHYSGDNMCITGYPNINKEKLIQLGITILE